MAEDKEETHVPRKQETTICKHIDQEVYEKVHRNTKITTIVTFTNEHPTTGNQDNSDVAKQSTTFPPLE